RGRGGGATAVEADDLAGLDHLRGPVGDALALRGALVAAAGDGREGVGDVDRDAPAVGAAGELGALHLDEVAPHGGLADVEVLRDVCDAEPLGRCQQGEHVVPARTAAPGGVRGPSGAACFSSGTELRTDTQSVLRSPS